MNMNPGLRHRLEKLKDSRRHYSPVNDELRNATMTALLGPHWVGIPQITDDIISTAASEDNAKKLIPLVEEGHPVGEEQCEVATAEAIIDGVERRNFITWSQHPKTGHLRAIDSEGLGTHNFMHCTPDDVPMLRRAGFKALTLVHVVTPGEVWCDEIEKHADDPDFSEKIDESLDMLEYQRNEKSLQKIVYLPAEDRRQKIADTLLALPRRKASAHYREIIYDDSYYRCVEEMFRIALQSFSYSPQTTA